VTLERMEEGSVSVMEIHLAAMSQVPAALVD
jgi:hypothetical protein